VRPTRHDRTSGERATGCLAVEGKAQRALPTKDAMCAETFVSRALSGERGRTLEGGGRGKRAGRSLARPGPVIGCRFRMPRPESNQRTRFRKRLD
jgi:hypothetical protein